MEYQFSSTDDQRADAPVFYRHIGALRYFDGDGVLHDEPGIKAHAADVARRWLSGQLPELPKESFFDHAPIRYAELCLKNVAPVE